MAWAFLPVSAAGKHAGAGEGTHFMSKCSEILLAFRAPPVAMPTMPLDPRKAPRQARARATHEAILEAATQILSAQGLKGFNTNAIAARAGTSIGSLYQYFPNKDALMLALIHRQKLRMLDHVAEAMTVAPHDDLEAAVRCLIQAVMKHSRDDTLLASAIDHEEARLPIEEVIDDYLHQGSNLFTRLFRQCSELDGLDHRRAARTVPMLIQGIMDGWPSDTPAQLDLAESEAVHAVLGYLRHQKGDRVGKPARARGVGSTRRSR